MRAIVTILCLFAAAAAGARAETRVHSVGTAEGARPYWLHMPERPPGRARPLVLLFHGGGGNAEGALDRYGWRELADREGFLVAAPQGMAHPRRPRRHFWNEGSGRGPAARRGVDDIAYIAAVIDDVAGRYGVDPARIYATGFSMGASMAHLAGQRLSHRLAAVAPVSGHLWRRDLRPADPVSVMYVFGTADPISPVGGGRGVIGGTKPPIRASLAAWRRFLDCPGSAADRRRRDILERTWSGCAGGTAVRFVLLDGMGHHWPGGMVSGLPERWVGPNPPLGFNATYAIWRFFEAHPKQE